MSIHSNKGGTGNGSYGILFDDSFYDEALPKWVLLSKERITTLMTSYFIPLNMIKLYKNEVCFPWKEFAPLSQLPM